SNVDAARLKLKLFKDAAAVAHAKSSYARAMIELRADVELKDNISLLEQWTKSYENANYEYDPYEDDMYEGWLFELCADDELNNTIVVAMKKLVDEGFYLCIIRVEYEWKPPRCSSCKVFGHVLVGCHKKIISDLVKNLKNPGQATRGVQFGPKVGFKPTKRVYKLVYNKNSGKKKQAELPNQFGISNSTRNGSLSVAPDDDGKPIPKVVYTVNEDSDSEVEDVVDDHAVFMASTSFKSCIDSEYGSNSLFQQWRTTK
nr:hypothetical protein [Tanacetum cinerariifolium]